MTRIFNARILASLAMLVFVGAVVASATGAFFSDTETSTGNTFTAGAIDLQIDNSSYGFDWNRPGVTNPTGVWGPNPGNSWQLSDLGDQLFFSFVDLKPGDFGEDTISLHVNNNDAYACMAFNLTGTPENGQNEPEAAVDPTAGENEGELQNYLSFLFWNDDGDNVLEEGETIIEALSGAPGSAFTGEWLAIAEGGDTPLPGGSTQYIGKGWCFGTITPSPATPAANEGGPTLGNTGFICSGAEGDHNDAQTDGIVVDVGFYAVQSRNNANFQCGELPPFVGGGGDPEPVVKVGANLADYVAPTAPSCDVNVDSALAETANTSATINGGIAVAVAGQTVCVDDGTYVENVNVNKDITLASLDGAATTIIDGRVAITATGVTVTGFNIGGATVAAEGNNGVYVAGGSNGLNLSFNIIDGTGEAGAQPIGVHFAAGATTGATLNNNVIQNWASSGAYVNPTAGPITFTFNDFFTNNVGIGSDGMSSASILNNEFSGNTAEAIGMSDVAGAVTGNEIHTNNFIPAGGGNNVNAYETAGGFAFTLVDAENNHFAGEAEAARTNNTTLVDTEPATAAAYAQN